MSERHFIKQIECKREKIAENVIFLREDLFNKLINDNYLHIISYNGSNVSKSYYYHVLRTLKELRIINEDGKINFKLLSAYKIEDGKIKILPVFLFCRGHKLFYADYRAIYNKCSICPYYEECKEFLVTIKEEFKFKSRSQNPRERLREILSQLEEKILSESKIIIINDKER